MANESFEKALNRLEEITSILENGDTSLSDSIDLYEEGMKLVKQCSVSLESAKQKVVTLKKEFDGTISETPFEI